MSSQGWGEGWDQAAAQREGMLVMEEGRSDIVGGACHALNWETIRYGMRSLMVQGRKNMMGRDVGA